MKLLIMEPDFSTPNDKYIPLREEYELAAFVLEAAHGKEYEWIQDDFDPFILKEDDIVVVPWFQALPTLIGEVISQDALLYVWYPGETEAGYFKIISSNRLPRKYVPDNVLVWQEEAKIRGTYGFIPE